MWVLPFLNYYHAYPLTTFYQEWSAAMLGLCATLLLVSRQYWRQPEIPRVVLLPIGMMLLVVVQFFLGKVAYFGQALLYALYLLWAALLMMLGHHLRREFSLATLTTVLAVALLAGAELNALFGVLQHYLWHTFLDPVVTVKISSAVYGNIAQPNHFADYLSLGLASLGLLHVRGLLRGWLTVLLALPILFVLPLSGSRSTWLYLLWMVFLAYWWQRRDRAQLPLLRYSLLVLLGFGLMHLVVQLPWLAGAAGNVNTVQRLFGEVNSGGIRLHLWHEAWLIFAQFPLLGAGFGQFAWQHFQLGPLLHDASITGLYNNAHNLVLQLAAETGLAGLLILFGTLLPWLWRAQHVEQSIYHWWGYALLSVLGIHSLLEYPLWYAYFLGIASLLLGMFDPGGYRLDLRNLGRLSVALMLLLGVLSLQQLLNGYRDIEALVAQRPASDHDRAYVDRMRKGLLAVRRQALLQPYAALFMDSMIEVSPDHIADKLAYNEDVLHFVPVSTVAYRQALLLAQDGKEGAARMQMERAIWAYPGDFPEAGRELQELAGKEPARFSALLKFAALKYEEYRRAVHKK
jgi:O-antigen ligase